MSGVGFEPTIPAFERAKTVHALYRAATVIGAQVKIVRIKSIHIWSVTLFTSIKVNGTVQCD
jgi:hypothetical protein